ncbi:hypothetical protein ACIBJE_24765 [Micromonospora sp. NPDC050187]|uniref:hypothetical protein n=1 Tax=Micromonospora sp. NPDC050187 TaxID=3364277 RepID=UPI0037A35AEC
MNTRMAGLSNSRLDTALRSLDVAGTPTAEQRQRAAATLERIVTIVPAAGSDQPGATAPGRRSRRRLLLLSVAAAALTAAVVVLPDGVRGGGAYASWTPVPTVLTAAEVDIVAPACRDRLRGGHLDLERARLVLAERRGEYVVLLYRTDDPDMSGSCLAHNRQGTEDVDDVTFGIGGGSGPARPAPARGFTQGTVSDFRDASITDGAAGVEVAGVTIHAGDLTVQASVSNGRYVAWWPGPAFEREPGRLTGESGPRLIVTYDLTLTDGTVVHDAQPSRPS